MKYMIQCAVIGLVTFAGELCSLLLPLPIPASVYGLVLMFLCLMTGAIKLHQVEQTADFLIEIMPIMFIGPSVAIMEQFSKVSDSMLGIAFITMLSTAVVMVVTGVSAQACIRQKEKKEGKTDE